MDHRAFILPYPHLVVCLIISLYDDVFLFASQLKKALKGVRVAAKHRPNISMRYKITGLTSAPLSDLTYIFYYIYILFVAFHFTNSITPLNIYFCVYRFDQDGISVSVVQYFKRHYNYYLQYTHWPCLQAGNNANKLIYLPIEVLHFSAFLSLPLLFLTFLGQLFL